MNIPTLTQIQRNFQKNVQLPAWRATPMTTQPLAEWNANQKILADYLLIQAAQAKKNNSSGSAG
jgi:hypothetical protein